MSDQYLLTDEKRARLASQVDLEKFARLFPDTFARAYWDARSIQDQAPRSTAKYDEPAHIFCAAPKVEQ